MQRPRDRASLELRRDIATPAQKKLEAISWVFAGNHVIRPASGTANERGKRSENSKSCWPVRGIHLSLPSHRRKIRN